MWGYFSLAAKWGRTRGQCCFSWDFNSPLPQNRLQVSHPVLTPLVASPLLFETVLVLVDLSLELDDGVVPLIQSRGQTDHDVPLLQQQMLVSLDMDLIVL